MVSRILSSSFSSIWDWTLIFDDLVQPGFSAENNAVRHYIPFQEVEFLIDSMNDGLLLFLAKSGMMLTVMRI